MGYHIYAIGKAIRALFADRVTYNKCMHYEVATLRYLVSVLVLADTSQLSTWYLKYR